MNLPSTSHNENKCTKIGFIVRGETDAVIIETLAQKILSERYPEATVYFATVSLYSPLHERNMLPTIDLFGRKGYKHIIVVFDAEPMNLHETQAFKHYFEFRLTTKGLASYVSLVPVIPVIEMWLFAAPHAIKSVTGVEIHPSDLDTFLSLKKVFQRLLLKNGVNPNDETVLRSIANQLNLEEVRKKVSSFCEFEQALERAIQ